MKNNFRFRPLLLSIICFGLILGLPTTSRAGDFWQTTGSISGNSNAFRIIVDSQDRIYVGVQRVGVFISSDNGGTWTNSGVNGPSIMALAVNSSDHVFAVGNQGVYRTTDNGNSWENVSIGLPSGSVNSIAINSSGRIFIGFYGQMIYRSDDNGQSWERLENGLSSNTVYGALAINSSGHIFAGTNGSCVYRSTDNGDNWQQLCSGLPSAKVWALAIDSEDRIFAGTGNGICVSTDNGDSWTPVTSTTNEFEINDMAINSVDHIFATNNYGGIWRSIDHGTTWENLTDPVNGVVSWGLGVNSTDYLFCGIGNGQVYRSVEATVTEPLIGGPYTTDENTVLLLHFDNSLTNSSGLSDDGVAHGSGISYGPSVNSSLGQSIKFDNSNFSYQSYISIPHNENLNLTDSWTIEAWFYFNSVGTGAALNPSIVSKTDGTDQNYFLWYHNSWASIKGQYTNSLGVDTYVGIGNNPITIGKWYHITYIKDAVNLVEKLIIRDANRNIVSEQETSRNSTDTTPKLNNTDVLIGAFLNAASSYVDGYIDEVRISNIVRDFTSGSAPTTITEAATSITSTTVTFNGTVNPNGLSTIVSFEYGETSDYGNQITAERSPIDGTSNVSVSVNLTGLSENTTYHYRVVASNSAKGPINGADRSFVTLQSGSAPTATTNTANNVSTTSATLNGLVNPNDLSTTVTFEYGESTAYGNQATADQSPLTGSANTSVSANITGLSASTTYHYRVVATNSASTVNGADQLFTTLAESYVPVVTTQTATNITANSARINGQVTPRGDSTTVIFEWGTNTAYGNQRTMTDPAGISGTTVRDFSTDVDGLNENTTYHYRVVASNPAGTIYGDDLYFITSIDYPSTYNLDHTINFTNHNSPSDYTNADYRILGLPGNLNADIATILTGQHGTDWQIYWDNGEANNYLLEYSPGNTFNMTTGKAFWILYKGTLSIRTSVSTNGMNVNSQVEIPLHAGWNMIANPFNQPVNWETVKTLNNITDPIWGFVDGFTQSDLLNPYVGYFLFNTGDLSTLKIPYPTGGAAKQAVTNKAIAWQVGLELRSGDLLDVAARIGIAAGTKPGIDTFDQRRPRPVGKIPVVTLERPNWDMDYPTFATDFRPDVGELSIWDFAVTAPSTERPILNLTGIDDIPREYSVILIDRSHRRSYYLRKISEFGIETVNGRAEFSILIGKPETVEKKLKELIPEDFILGTAFPNPFNPTTTIPLEIPNKMDVTLDVYNLLGERISRLHSGQLEAGRYYFTWDGKDQFGQTLPSGVYIVRSVTRKTTLSRKIVMIK